MDTQAEANFSAQIRALSTDKTLILITHRQNLLQLVDRLIVLEAGQVIADGPRDDIIKALNGGKA
jgi:ATP-binding cassette subfamily C protein LapB